LCILCVWWVWPSFSSCEITQGRVDFLVCIVSLSLCFFSLHNKQSLKIKYGWEGGKEKQKFNKSGELFDRQSCVIGRSFPHAPAFIAIARRAEKRKQLGRNVIITKQTKLMRERL
jgi:hypothetical protein